MFLRCLASVLTFLLVAASAGAQSPAPANTPAAPAAPQSTVDEPSYNLRLRNIEERVNDLKEKVFQSKARLIQLQEVVLHGAISGAKAVIVHKNEMGGTFRMSRLQYALDGAPIYNRVATGEELEAAEEIEVFNGSIAPGNHQLSLYIEYTGSGYGVFSYLKGYTFKVKSSQMIAAEEGKLTFVRVVAFEKGNITTELKDRPAVRYEIDTGKSIGDERKTSEPRKEERPSPKPPIPTPLPSTGGRNP